MARVQAYCFYFTRKDTLKKKRKKNKPFQTAIGAGLRLILPYLAEQVTVGSVITGSANTDFTQPPQDLNSPSTPAQRSPMFAAANTNREQPANTQRI